MKKSILIFVVLILLFSLSSCGTGSNSDNTTSKKEETEVVGEQTEKITPAHIVGVFVYERFTGELPYIITSNVLTFNEEGTFEEKFVWTSKEGGAHSSTEGSDEGTWTVKDNVLILTNQGGFETKMTIEGNRLIKMVKIGFNSNEFATVYYLKE